MNPFSLGFDSEFWIYLAFGLFFILLGSLAVWENGRVLVFTIWISAMIAFITSTHSGYKKIFHNDTCCTPKYHGWVKWLLINLFFIFIMVCATSWLYEIGSNTIWSVLSGIFALLGGVFLLQLHGEFDFFAFCYTVLWIVLLGFTLL